MKPRRVRIYRDGQQLEVELTKRAGWRKWTGRVKRATHKRSSAAGPNWQEDQVVIVEQSEVQDGS